MTKIPETFDEALTECEKLLGENLKAFIILPEKDMCLYHHNLGRYIRNSWGFWRGDGKLKKWFHDKGILHPDDMSSIIIDSTHRKLNNKPIELENQIQYYIDYWKREKK